MSKLQHKGLSDSIAYWGGRLVTLFVFLEIIFFPSMLNMAGCCMTVICWTIFKNIALKDWIIQNHIFAWLIFFSASMLRILALFATFLEFKPITYNLQHPYLTFFWETLLYFITAFAFYLVIYKTDKSNNTLQRILFKVGFYDRTSERTLWLFGIIGLAVDAYILFFSGGYAETGDTTGRFISGFVFLKNAPLLVLFPKFYKKSNGCDLPIFKKNNYVFIYLFLMLLLSLASNSRRQMLDPVMTLALLYFLSIVVSGKFKSVINAKKIVVILLGVLIFIPVLSDISNAMIYVRSMRDDVSRKELFNETFRVYTDKDELKKVISLRDFKLKSIGVLYENYDDYWSELYIDNFMFNRYCNLKITDMTLHHAGKIGYSNSEMQKDFGERMLKILPLPILEMLSIKVDKMTHFTRGDKLYSISSGGLMRIGYRITSDAADGLATFGYWFILIRFLLFYLQFSLVGCFSIRNKNGNTVYSIYGLISLFAFIAMFTNGAYFNVVSYFIRGFIQSVFMYLIAYHIVKRFK